ncbi:MAG TPA: hypothetical protein VMJ90_01410 [Anaerolineales bacterium]|nr:hypothetical protein [Anaerolineales bacterium]
MKTVTLQTALVMILILLPGCYPAATEVVPATAAPADTATPPPPTVTVTPPAGSPTPIPTANFTLAEIVGMWTRSDPDRGDLFLIFREDGSYVASHGTPEGIVHTGQFSLEGRIFTFINGWNCSPQGETEGQYILRLAGGGKYLLFEPLDDTCPDRPSVFKSYRWDRAGTSP